jgi:alpha-beta hydrolase superfamily lysophospholipase
MDAERFELDVEGDRLVGLVHRPKEDSGACIIACHGLASYKDSNKYLTLAARGNDIGASVVRFDFRGLGESEGDFQDSNVTRRLKDLGVVMDHVEKLGHRSMALFGSSLGGYVALLKTSADPRVQCLVAIATPFQMVELLEARSRSVGVHEPAGSTAEELGEAFVEDLKKNDERMPEAVGLVKAPTLIMHGSEDQVVPFVHAKRIAKGMNCERSMVMVAGADHVFSDPDHLDTVMSSAMDWYKKHLLG